jgi:hypothetical protein
MELFRYNKYLKNVPKSRTLFKIFAYLPSEGEARLPGPVLLWEKGWVEETTISRF